MDVRPGRFRICRLCRGFALAATVLLAVAGCERAALEYTEIQRIDEVIPEEELHRFLRVVQSLPERRLPDGPAVYAPLPEWSHKRTLPVNELAREEQAQIEQRWSIEDRAAALRDQRALQRSLRREGLTPQQFVGLSLALGTAMSRSMLRDAQAQDLDRMARRGDEARVWLATDRRPLAEHSLPERHHALRQAAWLTRAARARRLREVPPENVALVRQHWPELEPVFPAEFRANPLDPIADRLEEQGVPFEELPESGSDERIEWTVRDALIGHDPPDAL